MGKMKNMEQWRSCMDMWRIYKENETHIWKKWWIWLKKWRNLYGKNMEKWRICMERWSIHKESEEFLRKNDDFLWKSERIYMVQRYSKYIFFDVNCILRDAWGSQNFNSIFYVDSEPYIYIHMIIYVFRIYRHILIHIDTYCAY